MNRARKILSIMLSLFMLMTFAELPLGITASAVGGSDPACTHTYGYWSDTGDGINHKRTCSLCGDVETAPHTKGANPYQKLDESYNPDPNVHIYNCSEFTCGAPIPGTEEEHTFIWEYYEGEHWRECSSCYYLETQAEPHDPATVTTADGETYCRTCNPSAFAPAAYTVTVTGGTADKTTAAEGETVTVTATVPTGKKFGSWTATGGITLNNTESASFKMPAANVEITAVFENDTSSSENTGGNTNGSMMGGHISSGSDSTNSTPTANPAAAVIVPSDSSSSNIVLKAEAKPAADGKVSLLWNKINGAEKYVIYKQTEDGLVKVGETKKTSVSLKNSNTETYVIKYVKNGKECSDKKAVKITVEGTKPEVEATATKTTVKLDWEPIAGAEKYAVYKVNSKGKLVKVKETEKDNFKFTKLKSGKTYKYAVKAYVNGEWSKVTKSDIITVKTKK